ncbi:alpha-amylase-like [Macrosteles quadrilineatus]|uniref:alpha-amylase-like n=1 Tax=Macrosteles quadrilineatus TaxID=74068 RepID=UPI0023E2C47B|nr:alpha-amylase-like [Macrosteles quadrilineatus]
MTFTRLHVVLSQLTLFLLLAGKIDSYTLPVDVENEKPASPRHGKTFELKSGVIANLFMWRWSDIADECEQFLSKKGFDGVQISPPVEHVKPDGLWDRYRYQVVSYQLISSSGSENQLRNMVKRCNKVGVRVFVDVIITHMTEVTDRDGVGGSSFFPEDKYYPSVPYTKEHFHPRCEKETECAEGSVNNLDLSLEYVREKIVEHLNHLIEIGVAGFRINLASFTAADNLSVIYQRLHYLNTEHGFPAETRPLIYQELLDLEGEDPIKYEEYTPLGLVLNYKFGHQLAEFFLGNKKLKDLQNFGSEESILPKRQLVVFVENHITEGNINHLSYKKSKVYKMAVIFMLAHADYTSNIFSGYSFEDDHQGPPDLPPRPIKRNICSNGWECQHRWRQIYNAVEFHNVVKGTPVINWWWSKEKNQIAFCRGNKGFVAFNLDSVKLNENLQTCLPEGEYCDIISGEFTTTGCSGKTIKVEKDGKANIVIPENASTDDGVVAIHIQSGTVYGDGNSEKTEM